MSNSKWGAIPKNKAAFCNFLQGENTTTENKSRNRKQFERYVDCFRCKRRHQKLLEPENSLH